MRLDAEPQERDAAACSKRALFERRLAGATLNFPGELEIADHVYVMRTGMVLSAGSREAFGGDTEALVARWLYASGNA